MKTLRLILGDQLNSQHSWFEQSQDDVLYVMMEIKAETSYVRHHIQKILAVFAAMRAFHAEIRNKGFNCLYYKIDDAHNQHHFLDNLSNIIQDQQIGAFEYQAPDEYRLDALFKTFATAINIPVTMVDSEHFLTGRQAVKKCYQGKKQWRMETFYREMRKQYEVLLENGQPIGGQWNYDAENRKVWKGSPSATDDFRPSHNHEALLASIYKQGIDCFGTVQADEFKWPINRAESLALLDQFIAHDLIYFGDFQDAMHTENWRLFHSFLSFSLNTKMLSPLEVVRKVEAAYHEMQLPLASVEGFIRQILGWREYVRGVYWANMPGYDALNYFHHKTPLPDWFWTGNTHMHCVANSIKQSLQNAYAHHIQRLMIIGNFSLLAGLDTTAIHQWYLGIYIDAFEWVELPNTLGMSQYADGGLLATKPYVSSASYINKMSNYCGSCRYNPKQKTGHLACPFNSLYWDFFARHQDKLASNPRLGIVNNQLNKMDPEQKVALSMQAKQYLSQLEDI